MPNPLRILIADDNEAIRNGLRSVLESRSGWVVCGQAVDGRDAVEKAFELEPDMILVDVSMPHLNGFEVARCIHERLPDCGILVVTEQDPRFMVHLSPQPGVSGYVVKSRITLDLLSAVEAARKQLPSSVTTMKTA
ncbi:MAG TPA: response regulator transcription factor [Candidatus Sulfotelmatobacter sp.]|nr:response regulator transcription factor [Candidatus Sulfotelmatobacter sp.]